MAETKNRPKIAKKNFRRLRRREGQNRTKNDILIIFGPFFEKFDPKTWVLSQIRTRRGEIRIRRGEIRIQLSRIRIRRGELGTGSAN